ncbi:DUF2771 family protein [Corynebacterium sp. UBA2622]|uniref:DUF2771 family protein n=1 Tax=Corynebacterium sp. UBA2622 TaxID=1946393 RepID=UPI0025BB2D97|nr:DUF2771 family protein [Corynebacterium sp. UBA2622]
MSSTAKTPKGSSGRTPAWVQLLVLVLGVAVLVTGLYFFWEWQKNRPGTPVRDLRVEVSNGATHEEISPYTVCELDAQCDGGDPPAYPLDESSPVTFKVPKEISTSSWKLLTIYDDPAANDEQIFQSGQSKEASADAVKDGAHLVVAEVSYLAVDEGNDGNEIPVVATWSVSFDQNGSGSRG